MVDSRTVEAGDGDLSVIGDVAELAVDRCGESEQEQQRESTNEDLEMHGVMLADRSTGHNSSLTDEVTSPHLNYDCLPVALRSVRGDIPYFRRSCQRDGRFFERVPIHCPGVVAGVRPTRDRSSWLSVALSLECG